MSPSQVTEFARYESEIEGLVVITTKQVEDERGTVREVFRHSAITGGGLMPEVMQVNLTTTHQGAVRGLHGEDMTKLVGVAGGQGYGAYLDARPRSATFGTVVTLTLEPGTQVLVPPGVCNGFQAVSPGECLYVYCFDVEWSPDLASVNVHPLDPELAITWPIAVDPMDRAALSAKDAGLPSFAEIRDR